MRPCRAVRISCSSPPIGSVAHFGLPDSGQMPTVIAPDLSNLPAGERAVDPTTGEEFTKKARLIAAARDRICAVPSQDVPRTVYSSHGYRGTDGWARHRRQGPAVRGARPRRQRRHRARRGGAGLQPRGDARLRRAGRRREGSRDVRARVHPDAAGRLRLQGTVPGHPRLRHDVHLGHQGFRAVDRLDRRLGPGGVGDHRAGQRRRGRRDLPVPVPRPGRTRREPLGQGASRARSSSSP